MTRNNLSKLFATAAILSAALTLSAQNYGDGIVDKSVAVIGNEVIMISDVESEAQMMRARGASVDAAARCEIFENLMVAKLFLTQARLDSLTVNEVNVQAALEQRINEVVTMLGGEPQAEEYFGKPMHKLRQEWAKTLREQSLIQDMQQQVSQKIPKLTPKDIKKYFKETPEEDLPVISTKYRIRQIGVYPDKEAAAMEVKEKLVGLRERVIAGEKFATLARLYSEDPGTAMKGGELGMAPRSVYWAPFSDAAMSLKIGQVSQVVETPDGFHIIQLIDRDGDMFNASHILIKPRYNSEDREKGFKKLDSLRNLIVVDSMKFFDVARANSEELMSATNGGLMADEYTGSSYFEKDQLKPADYAVLKEMQVGDISQPIESLDNEGRNGNTIYKILYLEKIIPSHVANFEDDFMAIQQDADAKNSQKAIEKFILEKQKTNYIVVDPLFEGCSFRYPGWGK